MQTIVKTWICECCTLINTTSPKFCKCCKNESFDYNYQINDERLKTFIDTREYQIKKFFGGNKQIIIYVINPINNQQMTIFFEIVKQKKITHIIFINNKCNQSIFQKWLNYFRELDIWIGVNFIEDNNYTIIDNLTTIIDKIDGIMINNSYIYSSFGDNLIELFIDNLIRINFTGLLIGGFYLDHSPQNGEYCDIIQRANKYFDIIYTNNSEKIDDIKKNNAKYIATNYINKQKYEFVNVFLLSYNQ
jgi:hypothetical protein